MSSKFLFTQRVHVLSFFSRRFAVKKCARCEATISANELVMKARSNVYHINCFSCVSCNALLNTGEHFGMKDSQIYCKIHYELLLQQEECMLSGGTPPPLSQLNGLHHGLPYMGNNIQKGRPRKRKSPLPESDMCGVPMGKFSRKLSVQLKVLLFEIHRFVFKAHKLIIRLISWEPCIIVLERVKSLY